MISQNKYEENALPGSGLLAICPILDNVIPGKVGIYLDEWFVVWAYRAFEPYLRYPQNGSASGEMFWGNIQPESVSDHQKVDSLIKNWHCEE